MPHFDPNEYDPNKGSMAHTTGHTVSSAQVGQDEVPSVKDQLREYAATPVTGTNTDGDDSEWDPEATLASAELERGLSELTPLVIGKAKLNENVDVAVDAIIFLAQRSASESIRFKAATYIIDRVYGPIGQQGAGTSERSPLEEALERVARHNKK